MSKKKKLPKYVRLGDTFYERMSKEKSSKIFQEYMEISNAPEISEFRGNGFGGFLDFENKAVVDAIWRPDASPSIERCPSGFAEPYPYPIRNAQHNTQQLEGIAVQNEMGTLTEAEIKALLDSPAERVVSELDDVVRSDR